MAKKLIKEAIAQIALASFSFCQCLNYCDQCAYTDRMIETIINNVYETH